MTTEPRWPVILIEPHARLKLHASWLELPCALGQLHLDDAQRRALEASAQLALGELGASPERAALQQAARALLRHGGYKPSGRGKPASEHLASVRERGPLSPINALVDVVNLASLYGALPLSALDADKLTAPLRVALGDQAHRDVPFNPSGQTIDMRQLLALHDAQGPTGTPVKDAQRSKTDAQTRRALIVIWGDQEASWRADQVSAWLTQAIEASLGGQQVLARHEPTTP